VLVGLHDGDKTRFPNLALMKISAYHKARGDQVEWFMPIGNYDKVYSSKVFTFSPDNPFLPKDTIKGGTGYGLYEDLPEEIDNMPPDYSIYPDCDYAIGFLTRGCIRKCPWCVVPKKEGTIRPYRTWREIKRPDSKRIVFMDNNVLACPHGVEQLEDMIGEDVRIDINQGLDARLIDDHVAHVLSQLKWIRFIRMSCDTDEMLAHLIIAMDRLVRFKVSPSRIFVYVLVNKDIPSAERRVMALRAFGANPFAQPYRDYSSDSPVTDEQRKFARWVNRKAIFKSCYEFSDYWGR